MAKLTRHRMLLQLLHHGPLASQDEMRRQLARQGLKVTQATLSRDIREMGLIKTPEGYALPANGNGAADADALAPSVARVVRDFVLEVRQAQNMLVLKTTAGSAQPVAVALDAEAWPEVIGTIAGDDTVLMVSTTKNTARKAAGRISEMLAS